MPTQNTLFFQSRVKSAESSLRTARTSQQIDVVALEAFVALLHRDDLAALLREREMIIESMNGATEEGNDEADGDSAEEMTINGGVKHGI